VARADSDGRPWGMGATPEQISRRPGTPSSSLAGRLILFASHFPAGQALRRDTTQAASFPPVVSSYRGRARMGRKMEEVSRCTLPKFDNSRDAASARASNIYAK
jgi:hypothetical protein